MESVFQAFSARELTFAALFTLGVIMLMFGRLMTLRHHREVVQILEKEIEDWKSAAREALMQNSLLLSKDDVATTALSSIHEMVQRHEGEEPGK